MKIILNIAILSLLWVSSNAQIIQNVYHRNTTSLNGEWKHVIDPYETGYRNHRNWTPFDVKDFNKPSAKPYYANKQMENRWERIEYNFEQSKAINVPSDWNSQYPELKYYEGVIWYYKKFDYNLTDTNRLYLYFGASNYKSVVYLNGEKIGQHFGGYDPFNFEITANVKEEDNYLIVLVDNKRELNNVPNLTTDWWNYGGITRDVKLVEVPPTYINDYHIQIDVEQPNTINGYVQLNGGNYSKNITVEIPEIKFKKSFKVNENGYASIELSTNKIKRWYPERPKMYDVIITSGNDRVEDRIGFRTIETKADDILLNGKSVFLRGISLHEEMPLREGRANSLSDAKILLAWAKELNCNFIRLAHYPHNENMPRLADEMGLLLWEEIPVYWGINYEDSIAYNQAKSQLEALVSRDKNRASVIIWSVANETPVTESRTEFLKDLKKVATSIDKNRFISAALDRHQETGTFDISIQDPFAGEATILSANEYLGWYGSLPDACNKAKWTLPNNKPFFVSEFGAGALYGYRGDSLTRWTEDYQVYLYKEQIKMLKKIPSLRGMTPWILTDFRSPRRNLPKIQDGWNRKGLISNEGNKKQAFYILKNFYDEMEKKYSYEIND